ncbi:MAG: Hpt domain-containing protein [Rhizobiales bacterium]|nr:Hpt domain-containing protein [Hyphomicrobiales bacterium]MBI3672225.1 Hpt domain-containing protein [Hyphomicrobiales bacterium]
MSLPYVDKTGPEPVAPAVLDRDHLAHYTLDNPDLEREIIGLFLGQLPATIAMLKDAASASDWKLAAHTLKGSAVAVGAAEINELAIALERRIFNPGDAETGRLIALVEAAEQRFREVVAPILGLF